MRRVATRGTALAVALTLVGSAGCSISGSGGSSGIVDPHTLITIDGSIGGVHAREGRSRVELLLGHGTVVSTVKRQSPAGSYDVVRITYPASGLLVIYFDDRHHEPVVAGVFTSSPRYHTRSGLHVGSTFAQARHTAGLHCYRQAGYFACQGGLGYERPIISFTVEHGRVVRAFMASAAD